MTRKTREKLIVADEVTVLKSITAPDITLSDDLTVTDDLTVSGTVTLGAAHNGLLLGAGTGGSRETTSSASSNFIEWRLENSATSGDNRGMYLRLYLTGAGSGGESLRAFTTIEDVAAGTAHGAHISLNFGSSGSITGLGVAGRNTLHIPDAALSGGTYAALQAEIYADGSSSDISGTTNHSFLRLVAGGDATGAATIDTILDLTGLPAAGDGDIVNTNATILAGSAYASLKVVLNGGVVKYLHLFDAS